MTIAGDFAKDGFAVFPGALNSDLLDKLRSGIDALVDDFEPSGVATIFSTDDQSHGRDQYFLESGDKIRFFFEDGAIAPDGSLTADKSRSPNRSPSASWPGSDDHHVGRVGGGHVSSLPAGERFYADSTGN